MLGAAPRHTPSIADDSISSTAPPPSATRDPSSWSRCLGAASIVLAAVVLSPALAGAQPQAHAALSRDSSAGLRAGVAHGANLHVLPRLWAVQVSAGKHGWFDRPLLKRVSKDGINALTLNVSALGRKRAAKRDFDSVRAFAAAAKLYVIAVVPSGKPQTPAIKHAVAACSSHRFSRLRCSVRAKSPAAAVRLARQHDSASRLVAVYVKSPRAIAATAGEWGATSRRALVIAPLHGRFDAPAWGAAIAQTAASPSVDMGVAPKSREASSALEQLGAMLASDGSAAGGPGVDATPPSTPTGLTTSSVTQSSMALSWTASTDNVGVAGYRLFRAGTQVATTASTNFSFTGLNCGTSYTLGVAAYDAAGNVSSTGVISNSTSACSGPPPPTNLVVSGVGQTSVTLSWSASAAGYRLFLNGTQVGTAATTSYVFSGLSCQTTYTLGAAAVDANSVVSSIVTTTAQTAPCPSGNASVFVAQVSAGSADGSSCANAKPASFFNTASNWGAGKTIAPGAVVGLCGTISSPLAVQGSGTAGSPITIQFQPGAKLSEPVCNPCLYMAATNHITVDGGSNGVIESTANGTGLANQTNSKGINAAGCNYCEIKNLTIRNLYVHTSPSDENSGYDHTLINCIDVGVSTFAAGHDISIHDNAMHDSGWCIALNSGASTNSVRIYNNDIYNIDGGIYLHGGTPAGPVSFWIYGNHIHDYANWDDNNNENHHDGIHCFSADYDNSDFYIYNNRFDGADGSHLTGDIYAEGGCSTDTTNFYLFNNVVKLDTSTCCGAVGTSTGHQYIWNNTIIGPSPSSANTAAIWCYGGVSSTRRCTLLNNVVTNEYKLIAPSTAVLDAGSPDYNVYGGCTSDACFGSWATFSAYQAANPTIDVHSSFVANPLLNPDGSPQGGSAVLNAGTNLTGFCNTLDSSVQTACKEDINGAMRPGSGPWDAGAY